MAVRFANAATTFSVTQSALNLLLRSGVRSIGFSKKQRPWSDPFVRVWDGFESWKSAPSVILSIAKSSQQAGITSMHSQARHVRGYGFHSVRDDQQRLKSSLIHFEDGFVIGMGNTPSTVHWPCHCFYCPSHVGLTSDRPFVICEAPPNKNTPNHSSGSH